MKNSEIVSRIRNGLNTVNKDQRISSRWVLSVCRNIAKSYIAMQYIDHSLYRDSSLFTTVDCIEMIRVKSIDCCVKEFRICNTLMRSKKQIPSVVYSKYGAIIKDVVASASSFVDGLYEFKPTTRGEYISNKKRMFFDKVNNGYFLFADNYLWIPDTHVELVSMSVFTLEPEKFKKLSACDDKNGSCESVWDYDFICPDKILEYVIKAAIQEISVKVQIPVDERPDLDSNQKTAIQTN